ncbi:MAG: DNA integrity scanning protein DisA nucleotide-binding domain protein [Verrucomicrobiota bacterium]|nr:DNA integrity scanning protein DisA nucleotide-binding domain protein [Verrucomicrobiota bacterium]
MENIPSTTCNRTEYFPYIKLLGKKQMIYPKDIPKLLRARIGALKSEYFESPKLPSDSIMNELLEVAYHASFLTEEGRKLSFRVIFAIESDIAEANTRRGHSAARPIVFNCPRDFTVAELLRLSPAVEFTQGLICVAEFKREKRSKLEIWGVLDSGSSWWHFMHHNSSHGMPPPNFITISCSAPGQVSVSAQGQIFMTLRGGAVQEPVSEALYETPLGAFFDSARKQFHQDVIAGLGVQKYDIEDHDEDFPQRFYTFFIERLLFHIREKKHGGTIFFVPDYLKHDDTRLLDRISIKYPIDYDVVWPLLRDSVITHRKYYDLYFPLGDGKKLTRERFSKFTLLDWEKESIEESITDCVQFIAGLSGVDGAIVITDKLRVLGFGAEVIVQSQNLTHVLLPSGTKRSISDYGTRHRSAFRFCSSLEEAVAFIVSSDGGVKGTLRVDSEVALWPDINVGGFGI